MDLRKQEEELDTRLLDRRGRQAGTTRVEQMLLDDEIEIGVTTCRDPARSRANQAFLDWVAFKL